jgi:hypothetical protein
MSFGKEIKSCTRYTHTHTHCIETIEATGKKEKLFDLEAPCIETIEATGTLITDGTEGK